MNPNLTHREKQILLLVCHDNSRKEICYGLRISIKTYDKHILQVRRKLKAHTVIQLLRVAIAQGYITTLSEPAQPSAEQSPKT